MFTRRGYIITIWTTKMQNYDKKRAKSNHHPSLSMYIYYVPRGAKG